MLSRVHVLGSYWRDDADQLSPLGELVAEAKDLQSPVALRRLQERLAEFVSGLELGEAPLVLAVPPGPHREAHPVPALAEAVAGSLGTVVGAAMHRQNDTARLRDTSIDGRRGVVEAAGYAVTGDVDGRRVVLVDDVILTGTTLGYLAELLCAAGAAEVTAVVVCRTRRATEHRTAR